MEIYLGNGITPGFFGWLVPCGESTALAGLMAKEDADGRLDRFLSLLKDGVKSALAREKRLTGG